MLTIYMFISVEEDALITTSHTSKLCSLITRALWVFAKMLYAVWNVYRFPGAALTTDPAFLLDLLLDTRTMIYRCEHVHVQRSKQYSEPIEKRPRLVD